MAASRAKKTDRPIDGDAAGQMHRSAGSFLFEVAEQDIAGLDDVAFRELVARLCMASVEAEGMPRSRVTWGGDQRESDGGIDVRVRLEDSDRQPRWLPRRSIGFQVKATEMRPAYIRQEMRQGKKDKLLPSIAALIREGGAYIIAARDSVADKRLGERQAAMQQAAQGEEGLGNACLDYYDARRLADWVNEFPPVVAWVHQQLTGRAVHGWKPYGNWTGWRGKAQGVKGATEGQEALASGQADGTAYLPDEKARFIDPRSGDGRLTLLEGLKCVRKALRKEQTSVRLVGLSGVGKTRFVQALFEAVEAPALLGSAATDAAQTVDDPETQALPQAWALYTDTASDPSPAPLVLLGELLRRHGTAVLVVDNCAPSLHAELTKLLNEGGNAAGRVSVLTVEYDIREDLPNETEVFRLEGGSDDLIQKIVQQQFPDVSQINVETIAKFSDGNARVAIALAGTVGEKDSLAGLSDDELFKRLFWQRNEVDQNLMIAAQACALVYSFDGDDVEGELARLAVLADMSVVSFYRQVAELQRRGLVQQRGDWRAVLPHAIANTLAAQALESIPYKLIERQMFGDFEVRSDGGKGGAQVKDLPAGPLMASVHRRTESGPEKGRLLRSFSHRLSYLHDSQKGRKVVCEWLSSRGWLGDIAAYPWEDKYGPRSIQMASLVNVAPVAPSVVLDAIERALSTEQSERLLSPESNEDSQKALISVLRAIAYDAEYFERCLDALGRFARIEAPNPVSGSCRPNLGAEVMASLFLMFLSGTHAKTSQRVEWLRQALRSDKGEVWRVAVYCLSASLEARDFWSWHGFGFGARDRDYGWSPGRSEARDWLKQFILLAKEVGASSCPSANEVGDVLAASFRSLWRSGAEDALEDAAGALFAKGWEKGWIAVRQTLGFDGKELSGESRRRLERLEADGVPKSLIARIRTFVLNYRHGGPSNDNDEVYEGQDQQAFVKGIGREAARAEQSLSAIAELVTAVRIGHQSAFGEGLAEGTLDIRSVWDVLVQAFERHPEDQGDVSVLRGFLAGVFLRDKGLFNTLLDEAMLRPKLARWLPSLQTSVPLDHAGVERLLRLLVDEAVPVNDFIKLSVGRATWLLSEAQLVRLIEGLCSRGDLGKRVLLDVLSMYCVGNEAPPDEAVRDAVVQFLGDVGASRWFDPDDSHDLGNLARYFLAGEDARSHAVRVIDGVRLRMGNEWLFGNGQEGAISSLFELQPEIALDILVGDDSDEAAVERRHRLEGDGEKGVLEKVPSGTLISWCQSGPEARWVHVAPLVQAFEREREGTALVWSDQARELLMNAPDGLKTKVAEGLASRIVEPPNGGWSGSLAEILRRRLPLFEQLEAMLGPSHAECVARLRGRALERIRYEEERERARQQEGLRFE